MGRDCVGELSEKSNLVALVQALQAFYSLRQSQGLKGPEVVSCLKDYFLTSSESVKQVAQWLLDHGTLKRLDDDSKTFSKSGNYLLSVSSDLKSSGDSLPSLPPLNYSEIAAQLGSDLEKNRKSFRNGKLSAFSGKQLALWMANHIFLTRPSILVVAQHLLEKKFILPQASDQVKFLLDDDSFYFIPDEHGNIPDSPVKLSRRRCNTEEPSSLLVGKKLSSIEEIIHDASTFKDFRSFLASQFSEENLDFVVAVMKWTTAFSFREDATRRSSAAAIISQFVGDSSANPVNLDCSEVRNITTAVCNESEQLDVNLFETAEKKIREILEYDTIPKYNKTLDKAREASTSPVPSPSRKEGLISPRRRGLTLLTRSASSQVERR